MTQAPLSRETREAKPLLVFQPDHMIDIITNSSSELFVLAGSNQEAVTASIAAVYPDYLTEYQEVKSSRELTESEIHSYLYYEYQQYNDQYDHELGSERYTWKILDGFSRDEMLETKTREYPRENGRVDKYTDTHLRESIFDLENRNRLLKAIDPEGNKFFLFSLGDNPNFDMQEKLEEIGGERYHLG